MACSLLEKRVFLWLLGLCRKRSDRHESDGKRSACIESEVSLFFSRYGLIASLLLPIRAKQGRRLFKGVGRTKALIDDLSSWKNGFR